MSERPGRRGAAVLWAAVLALSLVTGAGAQTGDGSLAEVELFPDEEPTIQAATRTELPLSKAPGSVSVITARQIRESGARTIPELLRRTAGVNVRWNPMVQTLDIRSFGQNPFSSRVLLLIDGVPYNSWNKGGFPQHPGFDFFILQNIKRLEIVRGPGSALYGENAYWGVINIVTLSGEDLAGGKVELYGGDLLSRSLAALYGQRTAGGSYLVSGRIERGQLPPRFWRQNGSEVEGADLFLKRKLGNFELSYYRHEDRVGGFDEAIETVPGGRFRSARSVRQSVDILAFKSSHELRPGITLASDASYARRDGSRCGACHASPQNPAFHNTVDHGHQLIGDLRLGISTVAAHDVLIGVEMRQVDAGDQGDQLLAPGDTDAEVVLDYSKVAAYVQDRISLAGDRLQLILGARYDGSNDLFSSELSPRASAVWSASDSLVLRAGWSTAFRFPSFNELYQNTWMVNADAGSGAFPLAVFQPNPGLQPEQIRTFDFGAEYRFGPGLLAELDVFHSEVQDFIVLAFHTAQEPFELRFENHPDRATLSGAELVLRFEAPARIEGQLNWSYQENRQRGELTDSSGKRFEFVYSPRHKVNLNLQFGPYSGIRGALELQWRDELLAPSFWNEVRTGDLRAAKLDDYTLVNAKLSWDLPVAIGRRDPGLRLSLYGKNLLDDQAVETLVGVDTSMPGTTVFGAVELVF